MTVNRCSCLYSFAGNVKAEDGYFLYTDENGYVSSHAYTMTIDSVILRPGNAGIYFGGSFETGSNVPVSQRGIVVSLYNAEPVADGRTS